MYKMDERPLSMKCLAEDDRPREKMMEKGRHVLSNAELLATLIGSGTRNESALELAMRLLRETGGLEQLARLSVSELVRFKGIGEAKAVCIVAALELGRRRRRYETADDRYCIRSSGDIYRYVKPFLADLPHEEFWLLLLNKANCVVKQQQISKGGVDATLVDPKLVFKAAIDQLAPQMVLCHNHPSGNTNPSPQDCALTRRLVECSRMFDIHILDHIIFSDLGYYSFSDNAKL